MRYKDLVHSDELPKTSYYTASCTDTAAFDTLREDRRVDVCIVGGGFTGVASALQLAEQGYKVALLEQNQIGWGASGRNGGQVIGGYGQEMNEYNKMVKTFGQDGADAVWKMSIECVDILRGWVEKYNIDCDLKWGYLDAAMNQREMDELKHSQESLQKRGYPHEQKLLEDKAALQTVIGSDRYVGGLTNMGWGHVQPLNLVRGEARAAQQLGAEIYEGALVTEIVKGEPVQVKTENHTITADYVILGGNAYLGQLVPEMASRVLPAGSYIIATEPLSEEMKQEIMPADYAVCDLKWALDYYRMSADGRMLFGGLANYSGRHPKKIQSALKPKMERVFPQLENVKIDYEWGGYIGIGLNRIPQVGRITPNIYFAQAYSGHGVAPTHMSAKIIVEALRGQAERFDVMAKVFHPPFPGGRLFRQPMLAAGMMFYKLRDELGF